LRTDGCTAGVYTTFVMLMNTWSVVLTVLVLNLHHRNECRPIPAWLRIVAFEGLARLLCMYTQQHVLVYQHRIQQRRKSSSPAAAAASLASDRPRHSLHEVNTTSLHHSLTHSVCVCVCVCLSMESYIHSYVYRTPWSVCLCSDESCLCQSLVILQSASS